MGIAGIKKCRVCDGVSFAPVFDFGKQVIANHFHHKDDPECSPLPLALVRCEKCNLVQLADMIDSDLMYRNYWYRSGINQSMRDHLRGLAEQISQFIQIGPDDAIVDIGCNDGTFLGFFPKAGRRIGIDPSNIKPTVPCEYVNDYFTHEAANSILKDKKAKLITSIAMFYDLDDPKSFVKDIRRTLADDGLWVAELSYLPIMMGNTAYDSVCHEHVVYYRMETFLEVLKDTDLVPVHVEINQMNGGSFRVFVQPKDCQPLFADDSVRLLLEKEASDGYGKEHLYNNFAQNIKTSSRFLTEFLDEQKTKAIYGYGASTKGQIIMQHCRIDAVCMRAIAERNPLKYGLYTPGTNVPICSEERMRNAKPDFLVIFPWYFFSEFEARESALHDHGCKFVLPLPSFKIV